MHRSTAVAPSFLLRCTVVFACVSPLGGSGAMAGLSPENVVVVVNGDDPESVRIADHYMTVRDLPSNHRVTLRNVPAGLKITLDDFKNLILLPVLTEINSKGIAGSTQVIAYSSGFPTSVDVKVHAERVAESPLKKFQRPTASLTGMTYLYVFVLRDDPNYLGQSPNLYARGDFQRHFVNPFLKIEDREAFIAADNLESSDPKSAALQFEQLFTAHPTQAPLAIRAAQAFAAAGEPDLVKQQLINAIKSGWRSLKYVQQTPNLAEQLNDPMADALESYPLIAQEPLPFDAMTDYGLSGWPTGPRGGEPSGEGLRYMMSTMLAVVHPRANTVDEAIENLTQSSKSEQESPNGRFLFTKTSDVRTTTRLAAIPAALLWLNDLGQTAELSNEAMPNTPGSVMGLMLGSVTMPLERRIWEFSPGAIADNLTSYSATFQQPAQDKISKLLTAGVALTCGPVDEPYTIPDKFPTPMTYGYYANGLSAIESMYQGIRNPYQTLIVGDPLCQPFARPPRHPLSTTIDGDVCQLRLAAPEGFDGDDTKLAALELYIDGVLKQVVPPQEKIDINMPPGTNISDRLRVVLVGGDQVRSRRSVHPKAVEKTE